MIDTDDWRMQGQHYLREELLRYRAYVPRKKGLERDHCEFCWKPFRTVVIEGVVGEGFVTEDSRWICEPCYEDFKVIFDWRLET